MESTRAHRVTRRVTGSRKITGRTDMRSGRQRAHLHLQGALLVLLALTVQPQDVFAVGMFELQIRHFQNPHGLLLTGDCCDLQASGGQRCSVRDQCDTFFQACLKEYQARVIQSGTCTFGSGSTGVLGGNSHSLHHRGHDGGRGGRGEDGTNGHIVIPFQYAWPKSFSLVLKALDYDNDTSESGQLIERVLLSSMLNPGEQWQTHRHHGPTLSLEYRLRFRCDSNYYGPFCNKFCRVRDDFVGHFNCDPNGSKVCMEGWTGAECKEAVCKQGCHEVHGSCTAPGECKCHYGWKGPLCDQCVTFPGCVYGSCAEPWQCVCDVNWGGLLCDKDLNYCGTHRPCKNGGTCTNTEPDEYQCECQEGFRGRSCDLVEHACLSSPCSNGASCVEIPTGFSCVCADGWTGHTCADAVSMCDRSPCGRGATCREATGGFRCLCPPGWTGRTCQLDTNECEMAICVHARSCRNLIGGYLCDCLPEWTGPNCSISAMSDTTHSGVSFYIILVGILALVTVCGCVACTFILHLHHKRKKQQQAIPQEEGINNQREFVNLIRNVDRPVPAMPPAAPLMHPPAPAPAPALVSRCYEEIELTLPPSPAPSQNSPALKPAHAPKTDISNREREKLNRFLYTDSQELEA
ncbi:protein jagged-1b [Brachionichthys hirsutus]|uniref:protein jagged-1b n=1 Tax=Brachionichthys hirsutus TaxID=412623 RepID=UPI0036051ADA